MARALVVFYSRTNTTRVLAERLAALLDADLEQIVDPTRRKGLIGWLRCGFEAKKGRSAPIAPSRPVDGYDLVVVGTPMWAGCVSPPVRAYLRRHRTQLREVAFFCTRGGEGRHEVFRQMADEAGREPIADLTVRARDLHSAPAAHAIGEFAERLARTLAETAAVVPPTPPRPGPAVAPPA